MSKTKMKTNEITFHAAEEFHPGSQAMANDLVPLVAMSAPSAKEAIEVAMLLLADLVVHVPGNRDSNIAKAKAMFEATIDFALKDHEGCMERLVAEGIQTTGDADNVNVH